MFTMKNLENVFESAKKNKNNYIAVKVEMKGNDKPEIVINQFENFDSKLEYYKESYDDNLNLKAKKGIKITGAINGNDFAWIEKSLV